MADGWYLHDGAEQFGPLDLSELKRRLATQDSSAVHVWREGLVEWARPADLPELAPAQPPPLPTASESERGQNPADPAACKPSRFNNFIARNWRGEFSLGITYWLFGFLGNIFAGIFAVIIVAAFQSDSGYRPTSIFATILAVWIVVVAIAVWQSVGIWRSANRHIRARALLGRKSWWARLAKVAVFIGALRLAATFLSSGGPQLVEAGRMSFLGDPGIPAYSMRVMRDGTESEIAGGFKYGLTDEFRKLLVASPQIKVVHLDSLGGRIGEAVKLNKVIRERGLDTYVSSKCVSACTVAFAGGAHRILKKGAIIGFHAPAFPGLSKSDLAEALKVQKDIFATAGFDKEFTDKALSTPNSGLLKPASDALLRARVVTSISDGHDFAVSGLGTSPTRNDFGTMLQKAIPQMGTLKERFPAEYDSVVQAYYENFAGGKTEAEYQAAGREALAAAMAKLRPLADDAVLLDLGAVYADQYAALGSRSPAQCYQYASGRASGGGVSSEIPAALLARENEINKRVVETARVRPAVDAGAVEAGWKKIGAVLTSKGIPNEQLNLLSAANVPAEKFAEYCTAATMLFREIGKLPEREAGAILRDMMTAK